MTIAFRHIPGNIRVPGTYFDFDPSQANSGQQNLRTLLIGQVGSRSPLAAPDMVGVPTICLGAIDTAGRAGSGSMLALMAARYKARDSFGETWMLPLADDPNAVAATGTITFAGAATAYGTVPLYVGGYPIMTVVGAGEGATNVADGIAGNINDLGSLPVQASSANGVLTLTARHKGLAGNDIDIRFAYRGTLGGEQMPYGITAAIAPMSGGTLNPTLASAVLSLGDMPFEVIVCPYTDSASLDAIGQMMDDNTGRWSWARKLYGHVYAARRATLGRATTFGVSRNDQHVTVMPMAFGLLSPPEMAADYAAGVMESVRIDPAVPLQYIPTNIPAPAIQDRFVLGDRNTLLFDGLSTYRVNQGGRVEIERLVTTYQVNDAGVVDTSYLDCETMHTLGFVARDLDVYLTSKFSRVKLVADGVRIPGGTAMVNPALIKATLDTRYRYLQDTFGVVQDADGFAKESRVEIAGLGRANILAPIRLTGQLRILAILCDFRKTT